MPAPPMTLARHAAATRIIRRTVSTPFLMRAPCALVEQPVGQKNNGTILASLPCVKSMRRLLFTGGRRGSAEDEAEASEKEAHHGGEELEPHTVFFASHDEKMRLSCPYRVSPTVKFTLLPYWNSCPPILHCNTLRNFEYLLATSK
ncbi:hypothetical protein ACSSS7_006366 [Eimeria intestinalis]